MSCSQTISIGSDRTVLLSGLYDNVSAAYQNDATVTGVLSQSGTTVYSFSLSYVSSSDGNYRGTIPATTTADLVAGQRYTVRVTATATSGNKLMSQEDYVATYA